MLPLIMVSTAERPPTLTVVIAIPAAHRVQAPAATAPALPHAIATAPVPPRAAATVPAPLRAAATAPVHPVRRAATAAAAQEAAAVAVAVVGATDNQDFNSLSGIR